MRIAVYLRNNLLESDPRLAGLMDGLASKGFSLYRVEDRGGISAETDLILGIGGDGTFLSASALAGDSGIPVLGVNLGRLGFLSENRPETVADALMDGKFTIEDRALLKTLFSVPVGCPDIDGWPYALNEVTVHRSGAAMLGVDVSIDGAQLPTYWADGLLVATSSGSTAYSLSVGGPIVLPASEVLIIAPIASHNLNVRPLIVPNTAKIDIGLQSRDRNVMLTMDNRTVEIDAGTSLSVSLAPFPLKRMRLAGSSFIDALVSKLFWGEDIRNSTGQ
ncbi:MAG: NAD(+)/NADH kinase [Bacteroidales bacterium]|nr:NAD(+)/NADH kinase [Bacteroides sp.]MCM1197510.1 NAD(+)/NADH kinase [Clostridium sp.]MCM1502207.1 NAD(+)/NADH kinase [Bacteroidales bacterium]